MRYYQEIDFPNYEKSNQEILEFFKTEYPNPSRVTDFFNFPSFENFKKSCPTVLKGFEEMGLNVANIFMISVIPSTNSNIHIDGSTHPCRLQWPVLNASSVETVWYEVDQKYRIEEVLPDGTSYISYLLRDCKEVARTNITGPTVIRVEEPHAVERVSTNLEDFPRIAFSIAFHETLEDFLE